MNEIERLKSIDVNGAIKKALVEQEKSKSLDEIERAITTLIGYAGIVDSSLGDACKLALTALREQAALAHCIDCAHHSVPPKDSEGCIQFLYCNHPQQEWDDSPLTVDFADFCSCGKRLEVEHEN